MKILISPNQPKLPTLRWVLSEVRFYVAGAFLIAAFSIVAALLKVDLAKAVISTIAASLILVCIQFARSYFRKKNIRNSRLGFVDASSVSYLISPLSSTQYFEDSDDLHIRFYARFAHRVIYNTLDEAGQKEFVKTYLDVVDKSIAFLDGENEDDANIRAVINQHIEVLRKFCTGFEMGLSKDNIGNHVSQSAQIILHLLDSYKRK